MNKGESLVFLFSGQEWMRFPDATKYFSNLFSVAKSLGIQMIWLKSSSVATALWNAEKHFVDLVGERMFPVVFGVFLANTISLRENCRTFEMLKQCFLYMRFICTPESYLAVLQTIWEIFLEMYSVLHTIRFWKKSQPPKNVGKCNSDKKQFLHKTCLRNAHS